MASTAKLQALDGMRGIAAISVLLLHLGNWIEHRWIFAHGYLAVDFFFCLSGFVMAHAYGRRLASSMSFREFAIQRVIRLYPVIVLGMAMGAAYYAFVAMMIKYQTFGTADVGIALGLNLFLIPFYFVSSALGTGIYPLNTPFWSIFFEVVANLTWARFFVRVSPVVLFGIAAAIGLYVFPQYERLDGGGLIDQFWIGTFRVMVGFSAGLLVHRLYVENRFTRVSGLNPFLLLGGLMALFSVPNVGGVWYDMACTLIAFPILTFLGARASQVSGRAILEWLGDISYPLYGIHRPICLFLIFVVGPRLPSSCAVALVFPLSIAASLYAAHLVFDYFDEPIRNIMRKRLVGPKAREASLAAP